MIFKRFLMICLKCGYCCINYDPTIRCTLTAFNWYGSLSIIKRSKTMQINDIIFQIDQWARVTLNDKSPTYINEKIMHLQEEINEVALDPQDPLELADVFIL